MCSKHRLIVVALAAALVGTAAPGSAQTLQADPTPPMDAIAKALGVTCNHCHERGSFASDANPKKGIARQMIEMTREINARIRTATGKAAADATRIECATCHKGVPIPRKLPDLMVRTIIEKGADAAVEQYKELRAKYYAKDVYDFSEEELMNFCLRLAESARPERALPFLGLALELNPKASTAYVVMSRAYVNMRDRPAAIEALKKAIEINPDNGVAKGYLYQLDPKSAQ